MFIEEKKKSKRRVHYERVVNPLVISQGNHSQVKVARPKSRKHALGECTTQSN